MRRWLAFGLVGFWSLAASVAACGSDEAGSSSGAPEAGAPDTSSGGSGGDGATPGVAIVAADLTVYTGSPAAIDASQTNASEFAWAVKVAPAGSTVTTQSLAGATTARPSFVPDVSGDYVLELTARGNGASATTTVKVKAVAAPVFFMQTNFNESPPYFEYRTIGADKSGSHPVACRINGPVSDAGGEVGQFFFLSMLLADIGLDWWEAQPGSPSRVAFTTMEFFPDGGRDTYLSLGTNESSCTVAPAILRTAPEDGGNDSDRLFVQPRFSPNGARVAFVEDRQAGKMVGAVSYDGNDRRDIAPFCPSEGDCWAPAFFPPRPQWLDAQTIGWARSYERDGGTGWEVVLANDSANPNVRTHMTCAGAIPRSIALLQDGSVIANSAAADTKVEDLVVYEPATPGGACQVVRNLTNLGTPGAYARDFAVSPDGTEVVFVRNVEPPDDGGNGLRFGGELYVVPVNGSSAPKPFSGSPQFAYFGGRYVASGSQIAWNGASALDGGTPLDGGGVEELLEAGVPAVRVGMRDGGKVTDIVASDLDAGVFVSGGGNGGACDLAFALNLCSLTQNPASRGGPIAMAAAALAFAVRRRRQRKS